MQTIVKIIIALFLSHFTASEPTEEKKEEVAKALSNYVIEANHCASADIESKDYLI